MPVVKERHLIVPIFIPHQGCPFQCIYCRQDKITNQTATPDLPSYIQKTIEVSIKSASFTSVREKEVAFYGGTFANLGEAKMELLLKAVEPYIKKGLFNSIRVSTRPDSINESRLEIMKNYGVLTVELGVQSMDDKVLKLSKRGHSSHDVVNAVKMLKQNNFKVGIQLMPGLPGDNESTFKNTIEKVLELKPHMARLYPVVVIKETELALAYQTGKYVPLSLDEAIRICSDGCVKLEENEIPVIRIGLMSSPSLLSDGEILAGPWHTAFGFLVRSNIHQKKIEYLLPRLTNSASIGIRAPKREIPLVRGYKNEGIRYLEEKSGTKIAYIKPDDSVLPGKIEVDKLDAAKKRTRGKEAEINNSNK